jgi:hypothetical protein
MSNMRLASRMQAPRRFGTKSWMTKVGSLIRVRKVKVQKKIQSQSITVVIAGQSGNKTDGAMRTTL